LPPRLTVKAKIYAGVRHHEAYDAAGLQASQAFSQKYRGLSWTLYVFKKMLSEYERGGFVLERK
jgi:hypothetical protein